MTLRAGAVSAVEGKRSRLQLRHADAAIRTRQLRRIELLIPAHHRNLHQPARQLHRQTDRQFQPVLDSGLHQQPVDHDFDGVVFSLVQRNVIFEIDQFAVDPRPGEAVLHQLLHFFLELTLAAAHDRGQHHHPVLGSQAHHALHDLLRRLTRNGPPALGTVRHSYRSK